MARALIGLHATSAPSPYLQLFARMDGFERARLDAALYERRELFRVRGMRTTVFILDEALARVVMTATRPLAEPSASVFARAVGVTEPEYRKLAAAIEEVLSDQAARSAAELKAELEVSYSLAGVVNLMCDQARLIRDRPLGSWRSSAFRYLRFDHVLPGFVPDEGDRPAAIRQLAAGYVSNYGPVGEEDVAWWSGLGVRAARKALASLADDLVEVAVDGRDEPQWMMADQLATLLDPPPANDGVVLLPELDPYVMGVKDRERHLVPGHGRFVLDRSGNATRTILVDGSVVGVWDAAADPTPEIRLHLFGGGSARHRRAVEELAVELGRFWFGEPVLVRWFTAMTPLDRRKAGGFLSPLADASPTA